jgi:hypothetical protein
LAKELLKKGSIPRVTATDNNNGIFDFYQKVSHKNYRDLTNFISISFLGSVFYHSYTASLDMKIHAIQIPNKELNRNLAEFIALCLKRTVSIFSYGDQISSSDLPKKKILLPINLQGEPDYAFMEQFMRQKEQKKIEEFQNYIAKKIEKVKDLKEVEPLNKKEWGEFFVEDVFNIKAGKRLTKADMKKGSIPFIGASDSNNGITNFISNKNPSLDSNVLGANYNGSVVENFYHPYKAIFSDDVKRLSLKEVEGNEFLYLFTKTIILKQKSKFRYAYKFNEERMLRQKLLFPINKSNQPDYSYMENYIKKLEHKKLLKYLTIKTQKSAKHQ